MKRTRGYFHGFSGADDVVMAQNLAVPGDGQALVCPNASNGMSPEEAAYCLANMADVPMAPYSQWLQFLQLYWCRLSPAARAAIQAGTATIQQYEIYKIIQAVSITTTTSTTDGVWRSDDDIKLGDAITDSYATNIKNAQLPKGQEMVGTSFSIDYGVGTTAAPGSMPLNRIQDTNAAAGTVKYLSNTLPAGVQNGIVTLNINKTVVFQDRTPINVLLGFGDTTQPLNARQLEVGFVIPSEQPIKLVPTFTVATPSTANGFMRFGIQGILINY